MRINQNIAAINAWRNLGMTDRAMGKTMEKLSSGLRINRAADDAAGLAISERMRSQVNGLDRAVSNAQDGISLIQTAEGALDETHAALHRVRELTIQAANEVNEGGDVSKIQDEVSQLLTEIDRIAETTEFNTKNLLDFAVDGDGNLEGNELTLQIGANEGQTMQITLQNMGSEHLAVFDGEPGDGDLAHLGAIDLTATVHEGEDTDITFEEVIEAIDTAIDEVSSFRSELGSYQNRLEHTINNLEVASENLTAAESRIRDADMAAEMMSMTRHQIMTQAGTAMLAKANMRPQSVLQLLG